MLPCHSQPGTEVQTQLLGILGAGYTSCKGGRIAGDSGSIPSPCFNNLSPWKMGVRKHLLCWEINPVSWAPVGIHGAVSLAGEKVFKPRGRFRLISSFTLSSPTAIQSALSCISLYIFISKWHMEPYLPACAWAYFVCHVLQFRIIPYTLGAMIRIVCEPCQTVTQSPSPCARSHMHKHQLPLWILQYVNQGNISAN